MIHPSQSCSWIIMIKWNLVSRVSICFDNFLGCTSPQLMKPQNWLFWGHFVLPEKNGSKVFEWSFLFCWFFKISGVSFYWSSVFFWFVLEEFWKSTINQASGWFLRYTGRNLFLVKENEKTPEVFQFSFLFVLQRVSRMLVGSLFGHRVSSWRLLFMQSFPVGETKNQSL